MLNTQVKPSMDLRNHYADAAESDHIYDELQKSKAALDDPNTVLHDAEDVFARLERRLEVRGL